MLTFERMYSQFEQTKNLLLVKLALGATIRQASQELIAKTIKAALIPSIDSFKTIGLVQLLGLMTGMIIAGGSPLEAVRFQIIILFSQMASNVISATTVTFLSYKTFYTQSMF